MQVRTLHRDSVTPMQHRELKTENALGTEFYISLENKIVTFLGMTALAGRDGNPGFLLIARVTALYSSGFMSDL